MTSRMNSRITLEPKHRRLSEQLKRRLIVERLAPGERFLSVREIAKEYAVSVVTAHRSVRELVADDLLAIRQFHGCFVGDAVGSLRKSRDMPLVTVLTSESLFSSIDDFLPESFILGLRERVPLARIRIEYTPAEGTHDFLDSLTSSLPAWEPHAYVLRSVDVGIKRYFAERNLPAVVTGNLEAGINLPSVQRDERQVAYNVTKFLLSRGHQRIAYIAWDMPVEGTLKRREGFVAAMAESGLLRDPEECDELCIGVPLNEARLTAVVREYLTSKKRPTAIIFGLERHCAWGLRTAAELGVAMPKDLAVVALGGGVLTDHLMPRPTIVPRKNYETGAAVGLFIAKLLKGEPITERVAHIAASIVERETT